MNYDLTMKTILYNSGKFFGYEKQGEPDDRLMEGIDKEAYTKAYEKYDAAVAQARANALEIENPELAGLQKSHQGNWWTTGKPPDPIEDGDTFPLPDTLEWDKVEQFLGGDGKYWLDWNGRQMSLYGCKGRRQVLRLKEKAVVKDDRVDISQFASAEEFYQATLEATGGIVAIGGIPENDDTLPADGKFKEVFENSSLFLPTLDDPHNFKAAPVNDAVGRKPDFEFLSGQQFNDPKYPYRQAKRKAWKEGA